MKRIVLFCLLAAVMLSLVSCAVQHVMDTEAETASTEVVFNPMEQQRQPLEEPAALPEQGAETEPEHPNGDAQQAAPETPVTAEPVDSSPEEEKTTADDTTPPTEEPVSEEPVQETALTLSIDGTPVAVQWEDNAAVSELLAAAQNSTIVVSASRYGGFEQVGSLPQSFSRNDVQTTTQPGDIVLYSGDQLVVFFGSNAWNYTRLGHINGLSADELIGMLDQDTVTLELSVN